MIKPYLIILYLIVCVVLGAMGDGLNDDGFKSIGHIIKAVEVGLLISGAFIFNLNKRDWAAFFFAYVFWRVVGFDFAYNITRGLPILYVGISNEWDQFLSKFPAHGIVFARAIFMMVAIAIPFKHLRKEKKP